MSGAGRRKGRHPGSTRESQPHWGFHRLDDRAARYVVARADITAGELVVDLGAGTGVLTEVLLRAGARVVSVELHAGRAELLQRRFGSRGAHVVPGDLLRVSLPDEPYRVLANPPWALADSILGRLRRSAHCRRADLVLPRWQVRRWCSRYDGVSHGVSIRAESFRPAAPYGAAVAIVRTATTAG